MTSAFRDMTVERKLRLIMVVTALTALVTAGIGYGASDIALFRHTIVQETRSLAQVLGSSSVAALEFEDHDVAQQTLQPLGVRENVAAAGLYTARGEPLARYRRAGAAPLPESLRPADQHGFQGGHLSLQQVVHFQGRVLGSVYLRADMRELYQRATWFGFTALGVMLLSTGLAFGVAARLQAVVSRPILRLANAVRRVSRNKDYGVRVERDGNDELGLLIDGFNEMIARIQRHDAERESARNELARRAAELARSNAELDDFAYIASHDLKEPLRGIHNYSRFLMDDYAEALDEEGRRKLETLLRLTVRMERLIDTLLHYSRLGRTETASSSCDLDRVLHEVLDTLGPSLEEREVEVRIPRPLPHVRCDEGGAAEVFRNLVSNASKYNDGAERWVEIGWEFGAGPGPGAHVELDGPPAANHPVLHVRDNGIGVRARHLPTMFRIFKRLHGRDRYGGGTGAGLSIVKKIVERHGGGLWVESAPGEGTAFHFTVGPAAREEKGDGAGRA